MLSQASSVTEGGWAWKPRSKAVVMPSWTLCKSQAEILFYVTSLRQSPSRKWTPSYFHRHRTIELVPQVLFSHHQRHVVIQKILSISTHDQLQLILTPSLWTLHKKEPSIHKSPDISPTRSRISGSRATMERGKTVWLRLGRVSMKIFSRFPGARRRINQFRDLLISQLIFAFLVTSLNLFASFFPFN